MHVLVIARQHFDSAIEFLCLVQFLTSVSRNVFNLHASVDSE